MKGLQRFAVLLVCALILTGCTQKAEESAENDIQNDVVLSDILINEQAPDAPAQPPTQQQIQPQAQQPMPDTQQAPRKPAEFLSIAATQATIVTSKGPITVELYPDKTPVTVQNFLNLAEQKYYDDIVFHRVIPGFMAQVGDPLTKVPGMENRWGTGGPGYTIPDEFDPSLRHDGPGVLSMANAGPNTGGSQIFITFEAQPHLDGKHAVFGKVTEGLETLLSIQQGDTIQTITYK